MMLEAIISGDQKLTRMDDGVVLCAVVYTYLLR